jgi:Zinc carboxypeptidase
MRLRSLIAVSAAVLSLSTAQTQPPTNIPSPKEHFGFNIGDNYMLAKGKTVVWIDGGLHADEVVATQQLIEIAYQLTSRNDAETTAILDKVIILLAHANPDGMELVSNWYMRNPIPKNRSLEQIPQIM